MPRRAIRATRMRGAPRVDGKDRVGGPTREPVRGIGPPGSFEMFELPDDKQGVCQAGKIEENRTIFWLTPKAAATRL